MARNLHPGDDWVPATVVERTGPVPYSVETAEHQLWKRHVDQLKTLAYSVVVEDQAPLVYQMTRTLRFLDQHLSPLPHLLMVQVIQTPLSKRNRIILIHLNLPILYIPLLVAILNIIELNHSIMVTVTVRVQAKHG